MDTVQQLLIPQMSILFVVLLGSFTVNAAEEQYSKPGEKQYFKDLSEAANIKPPPPPPPPGGINQPLFSVTIQKSSQMRSSGVAGAGRQTPSHMLVIQEQIQRLGYREVSDEDMSELSLDNVKSRFIPIDDIVKNISSPLAIISIQSGIYKTMTLVGATARSPAKKTGKWTQVGRYFSLANGDVLVLAESDYKAGEYSVIIPEESVNETVNGSPATMVTRKTTSGKFFTDLTWFTETKMYTLHSTGRPVGVGIKNELVALATGVLEPVAK